MDKKQIKVNYWYNNNGNRFRKQDVIMDEVYLLGVNGETEAVFDVNGMIKFFNINSGNETIGRFAPTPVDLYLSNITLNGTYEATNSITVEDNVTVSGPTTLKAGNNIHLKPGFTAPSGIDFTAKIGTVSNVAKRFYYMKDHLGSIRVVVDETGNIISSDDYDPWGMILNGRSTNTAYINAKYKFTGKELDTETGYSYFGARPYDGRIGRWLQVDPMIEKYPGISPYAYSLNNPVTYFDPDGKVVWGPGIFVTAAGALEILGWATIATGVVISAVGPENTGKGIITFGEQIGQLGGNIMDVFNNPVTPTPFPITQGEGINQTTITQSDATNVSQNLSTLLDQGFTVPTTLESSSKQTAKQIAKLLGISESEAHTKIQEMKGSYEGNPDIKIDKSGNIKLVPTSGKNKGKEFDTGENIEQYRDVK